MARRRYISTDISLDVALNRLAAQSDFAALLYTWMIPHATDQATITGDPERLLAMVLPHRRDVEADDVKKALELLDEAGLFELWDRGAKTPTVYFHPASFYRYQTYVMQEKRREPLGDISENRP